MKNFKILEKLFKKEKRNLPKIGEKKQLTLWNILSKKREKTDDYWEKKLWEKEL